MLQTANAPDLDWLKRQLAELKAWRLGLGDNYAPASGLAEQIAQHEAWLAAQLSALAMADR